MVLQSGHGGALDRPSAGKAAFLGGAAIAAAAIAIGVAQIELSGKPQPDIWSNAWLLLALSLAFVGLMTAAVFFVIDIFAREAKPAINRHEQTQGDGGGQSVDRRESLNQLLVKAYHEGVAINEQNDVATMERDAPLWQARVVKLLKDSLDNQDCYLNFRQMGREPGSKTNNQLWNQTRYLEEILKDFDKYELRPTWQPPTQGDH